MTTPIDTEEEARQIVERFRAWGNDPAAFVRNFLGQKRIWAKQVEILEAIRDNPIVAVPSAHGVGKSFITGCASMWWKTCKRPSKVIITAPGGRQAQKVLGAEIRARYSELAARFTPDDLKRLGLATPPTTEGWELGPQDFVLWFATKPDDAKSHATKAAGWHSPNLLLVFEEAGGVPRAIYEATQGNLTDAGSRTLAIGNPSDPTGWFARLCRDSATKVIHISALDFPNVKEGKNVLPYGPTVQWVDQMERYWGRHSGAFAWKVLGRFPDVADDTLISYADVAAARERKPAVEFCEHPPEYLGIGVDVARFGDDFTSLWCVCGRCNVVVAIERRAGQDTTRTTGQTIALARSRGMNEDNAYQVAIDDTGVGGGVTDQLRAQGWRVRAVNFGASPERETNEVRFRNRRTEIWFGLRDWVRTRASLGTMPEGREDMGDRLMDDLVSPKFDHTPDGRVALEPKADIKKRIGRSPDDADAVALALLGALRARARPVDVNRRPAVVDPDDDADGLTPGASLLRKLGPIRDVYG